MLCGVTAMHGIVVAVVVGVVRFNILFCALLAVMTILIGWCFRDGQHTRMRLTECA